MVSLITLGSALTSTVEVGASCRIVDLQFDVAAAAGWYSAIAGVLAGFALLAILFPLDHEHVTGRNERHATDAVIILVCAFFSLLIIAFMYAVLSGRSSDTLHSAFVAAHEQLVSGVAFGLTTLLLVFALREILATYGSNREIFRPAERIILLLTSTFGPIIVLSFQFANAVDLEHLRILHSPVNNCGLAGLPPGIWINLAITIAGFIGIGLLALFRDRLPRDSNAPVWIAKATLVFSVLIVAWTSVFAPLLPDVIIGGALTEHLILGVSALGALVLSAASWSAR